jgi:hypothetical protein
MATLKYATLQNEATIKSDSLQLSVEKSRAAMAKKRGQARERSRE